jgi:ParB-like chromosome segregation protein Spo0J
MIEIKIPVLIETRSLIPNPWNPNKVMKPEMDLLEISIRKSGFCFPLIVIKKDEYNHMIVDGFHRHLLAKKLKMPYVPAIILDEPISELMNCTIRFNRAKGTHQIDAMSQIVKDLIIQGCSDAEIAKNLGMDADEVLRLKQNSGIASIFKNVEYSNSWQFDSKKNG